MVEPYGARYDVILRNRRETKEFLAKCGLEDQYENDMKKYWKGKESTESLLNLRLPIAIEIEYTYGCNLQCKYCYKYSSPQREEVTSFNDFKRMVSLIDKSDVFDVYVFGGEPLVLPEYLEYLLHNLHDKFIIVLSNGTLISDKICESVISCPNHVEFSVAIDGHTPELHNLTRGKFDKTLEGLNLLKKYDIPIRITTVLSPSNYEKLENIIKFAISYAPVSLKFSPIGTDHLPEKLAAEFDISEKLPNIAKNLFNLREKYKEKGTEISIAIDSDFDLNPDQKSGDDVVYYGPCISGITKVAINIDLEMVPCVSMRPRIQIPIRNSLETSFSRLKKKLSDFNREIIESDKRLRSQNCCQLFGYGTKRG